MSLAMFAASIDDNSNITLLNEKSENSDTMLNQKRHKKTQRKYPKFENFDTIKVNSMLQKIHESTEDDTDEDKDMFNPPPKPISAGVQKTIRETFSNSNVPNLMTDKFVGNAPKPLEKSDTFDVNDLSNYKDTKAIEEYYNSLLPSYQSQKHKLYNQAPSPNDFHSQSPQDILMKKINYMISLLEEQQDEKTNNVTEEVILYCFLGIFIIAIADTFVRAGKYVR
jgi:hypothetical protein